MLMALAQEVVLSWGWKRRVIAFFAGAIGALALAPIDFAPAMMVPMVVAVWLIDGCVASADGCSGRFGAYRDAAVAGWWLGFGYFVAGLWWLGAAFLVEADQFAWALPLGVLGLPALLAFFFSFGFVVARLLWSPGPWRIFALAAGLGLSEWLRGNILTGFPWNTLGMALAGANVTAQLASLVGLYGLTHAGIAIFAAPATLADAPAGAGLTTTSARPVMLALAALGLIAAFGAVRLSGGEVGVQPSVKLRIVQPNLPQDDKFRAERRDQILAHYLALSDRATSPTMTGIGDATHVIWPESAFPFILGRDPEAIARIAGAMPVGATLITGAARQSVPAPGQSRARFYNSIQLLTSNGLSPQTYDKIHLVPFGEYLPLSALLEKLKLRQFVHIPGGFEPGTGPAVLQMPGLPLAAPLICYEAIFPDMMAPLAQRPGWILNVTNDGWFGNTSGPYQHLAQARLRAIEQGLPLVRAANTGVSAVVDPYGRTVARLGLGIEGVLDAALPKPINAPFYARAPWAIPAVLWGLLLLLAMWGRRHNWHNYRSN